LTEGYERGQWILMDYFDFIVHIFSPATREFYGLERLWGSATSIDLTALLEPPAHQRA
jgi:ribosome-associated protein